MKLTWANLCCLVALIIDAIARSIWHNDFLLLVFFLLLGAIVALTAAIIFQKKAV